MCCHGHFIHSTQSAKQQSEILPHQKVTQAQRSLLTLPRSSSLLIPWLSVLSSNSCSRQRHCPPPCSCTGALLLPPQLRESSQSSVPRPRGQPVPPRHCPVLCGHTHKTLQPLKIPVLQEELKTDEQRLEVFILLFLYFGSCRKKRLNSIPLICAASPPQSGETQTALLRGKKNNPKTAWGEEAWDIYCHFFQNSWPTRLPSVYFYRFCSRSIKTK